MRNSHVILHYVDETFYLPDSPKMAFKYKITILMPNCLQNHLLSVASFCQSNLNNALTIQSPIYL